MCEWVGVLCVWISMHIVNKPMRFLILVQTATFVCKLTNKDLDRWFTYYRMILR